MRGFGKPAWRPTSFSPRTPTPPGPPRLGSLAQPDPHNYRNVMNTVFTAIKPQAIAPDNDN